MKKTFSEVVLVLDPAAVAKILESQSRMASKTDSYTSLPQKDVETIAIMDNVVTFLKCFDNCKYFSCPELYSSEDKTVRKHHRTEAKDVFAQWSDGHCWLHHWKWNLRLSQRSPPEHRIS